MQNDEIRQLAASFNNMADAVREHVHTLSESARLKELFASNMAHEIRTPITSIVAYSDYAARKDMDRAELQEILEYIKTEGERIADLSVKILGWSSINSREKADIRPCRPQRIARHVLMTLKPVAEMSNQSIKTDIRVSVMHADETLIISLLVNLCKNALNASGDRAEIGLIIENGACGNLIIKVSDTGTGIEENELRHITEPFYMVDKARDRSSGGSGLGLTLCRAIAKAHNGQMVIESVFGKGTCVTVKIPQKFTNP
jgi:signal transduction histidine kinase